MTKTHSWFIPFIFSSVLLFAASETFGGKTKNLRRTVAYSQVSSTFERNRLANGEWEPKSYALAIGKMLDPTERDESLSKLSVEEMAEILANALYHENYVPESDPDKTDIMIVVNWGKTIPFNNGLEQSSLVDIADAANKIERLNLELEPGGELTLRSTQFESELETALTMQSMVERARRQANDYNAHLLGFAPALAEHYRDDLLGGPQRTIFDDIVAEVETTRYFVILQAYDFQKLTQNKVKDLLWITRFSMRAKDRKFNEELANMARSASAFFGKESGNLKRGLLPGEVKFGELEVLDNSEDVDDLD